MEQEEPCVVELHDSDDPDIVRRVYIGEDGREARPGATDLVKCGWRELRRRG